MAQGSSTDWRERRRRRSSNRFLLSLLLALLGHVAFVGLLVLLSYVQVNLPASERAAVHRPTSVNVRPLTSSEWAKNRGQTSPQSQVAERPRAQTKKDEKKPDETTKPKGQVVDTAPGNEQRPDDSKYLAEHDNTVQKETRSREQTPFYRNAMPQRTAPQEQKGLPQEQMQAPRLSGNNGMGSDDRPLAKGGKKPAFEVPDTRHKQEVAVKTDPTSPGPGVTVENQNGSDAMVGNAKRLRIQPGEGQDNEEGSQGRLGSPGMQALMPSQAAMDRVLGAAPNDNLRDVDEGDATMLNTREWKYASFFNRVKQSVGMHWNPNQQMQMRDPTGSTYSGKDRYTLLSITLDEKGQVKDIQVDKSSGLDFLDMEAVSSFKRAQPFPNPPSGLLGQDATVRFQFGFFLEMGGGPRMRLFREPN
ncbi:energy transducer TonB [Corallococcus sp. H22C18031201]|uniref:energy transducer TonB family protein n=1 Tax=Citreicoccus inhibens TaxID=2849499 RepID=UPI000E70946F|nr:energy transducer TonB [Citreicoccus inhibens]MBU8900073.1 energy transducer TonB [Citreicoccus inhibens]RJS20675.1 energy transducer TonB [Corallococcus sp. H22C18031201]